MPFVHVRLAGIHATSSDYQWLRADVTDLMERILLKRHDLTSVLIEICNADLWSVGARTVEAAAHLEAFVTAGTNDALQKASFISEAHALLERFCGDRLPVATYVVVQEIPVDAWGYGGKTQAARQLANARAMVNADQQA